MGYFSTTSSKQPYTVLTGGGNGSGSVSGSVGGEGAAPPPSGARPPAARRVRVPGQRAFRSLRGWVTSCWGHHGGNRLSTSGSNASTSNTSTSSGSKRGGGGGARGSMISIIEGREPFAGRGNEEEEEEEYNDKMLLLDEECDGSGFLGFGVRDGRGVVFEERGVRC